MGIHYINGDLVGDGEIDAEHPEALIYEPVGDARRLVGVEYIVDAVTWLTNHKGAPPMLEGQAFQFVAVPTGTASPPSSNCMCGRGVTTLAVRLWTGITK